MDGSIRTKGQTEAAITNIIVKFEKEHMGRGPEDARSYIIDDMVVVRLKGVLTPAEKQLAVNQEGMLLTKQVRSLLLERSKSFLEQALQEVTGLCFESMHSDVSTKTGERLIIFVFPTSLEAFFEGVF